MTTVYLHVGMPKCASTTLQGYFHRFDRRNRKAGFVYPLAGRSPRGYFSHAPITLMGPDDLADVVTRIEAEARGANAVFLSSEQFVNAYWDRPVTPALIARLNATFGAKNVRLLFLFRNHVSFVESGFAQFLKGGLYRVDHDTFFSATAGDIESFCRYFRATNGFDFFDYAHVLETFRAHCDSDNQIEVQSIEPDDLETGDVLEELCRRFSLVPPAKRNVKNVRFPAKALLGLAYGIERYGFAAVHPNRRGVADRFADAADGFSPVLHVHGRLAEIVAARGMADADYFRREFGAEMPGLFRPRPSAATGAKADIGLTDADRAWLDAHFDAGHG